MMTKKSLKIIRTGLNEISLDEDRILRVRALKEGEMDLREVQRCFEIYRELGCNEPKVLQLMDLRLPVSISKEAREFVDEHAPDFFIASAVVSDSLAVRIVVNFVSLFRPSIPLKMFSTEEQAMKWLLQFKPEE
jgi:hypothetical protein